MVPLRKYSFTLYCSHTDKVEELSNTISGGVYQLH